MVAKQKQIANKAPWYESTVKKAFAIISGFMTIAAIGYGIGVWQKDLEFKLKENQLNQSCSEKIQNEINKYKEEKQQHENERVDNLEKALQKIEKKLNGRNRS